MLLIEQNVAFALRVADRFLVLKQGEVVEQGDARNHRGGGNDVAHLRV